MYAVSFSTLRYICYTHHFFVNSENLVQLCVLANATVSALGRLRQEGCPKFKATVRTCLQQTNSQKTTANFPSEGGVRQCKALGSETQGNKLEVC